MTEFPTGVCAKQRTQKIWEPLRHRKVQEAENDSWRKKEQFLLPSKPQDNNNRGAAERTDASKSTIKREPDITKPERLACMEEARLHDWQKKAKRKFTDDHEDKK